MVDDRRIDQDRGGCPAQGERLLLGASESRLGQAVECAAGGGGLTPARQATERMDARPRGDRANATRTRACTRVRPTGIGSPSTTAGAPSDQEVMSQVMT
jgi:hypothetical protein